MFYVLTDLADFTTLLKSYANRGPAMKLARKTARETGLTIHVVHPVEKMCSIKYTPIVEIIEPLTMGEITDEGLKYD